MANDTNENKWNKLSTKEREALLKKVLSGRRDGPLRKALARRSWAELSGNQQTAVRYFLDGTVDTYLKYA